MPKIFYDYLIRIEEITAELDGQELEITEKEEIINLIDDTFHHHTLNLILSRLPKEHHEHFLTCFHEAPHDPKLLCFLKETVADDIEELIRAEAEKIKKEILKDIKKSRRK
jgi:hypothetical protein